VGDDGSLHHVDPDELLDARHTDVADDCRQWILHDDIGQLCGEADDLGEWKLTDGFNGDGHVGNGDFCRRAP
jgi:hypothetical protein